MGKSCFSCHAQEAADDGQCLLCHAARSRAAYRREPARHEAKRRAYRAQVKGAVLEQYGGRCQCCGESEHAFLALDHMNNDGAAERRKLRGYAFYLHLHRTARRADLQVLCMNCNWGKRLLGVCPHVLTDAS